MDSVKGILNFCNTTIFYNYKNVAILVELNQVRKGTINIFYKTIPHTRILLVSSIFDDIILKINCSDIEKFNINIHDLRENVLHMLSFEKVIRAEQHIMRTDEDSILPTFDENNID